MKKYARKRKSLPSATGDVAGRPADPSPTDRGGASDEAHADGCGRTEHTLTNDANNAEADVRRRADAAPGVQGVSGSTGRKKLRQLHIDVGQRNFGAIRCRLCGMVYTPGLEEDEALHAKLLCPYSSNNKSSKVHSRCGFDKRRIVDAVHHHSDGRTTAVGTLDPFKRELLWPRLKVSRFFTCFLLKYAFVSGNPESHSRKATDMIIIMGHPRISAAGGARHCADVVDGRESYRRVCERPGIASLEGEACIAPRILNPRLMPPRAERIPNILSGMHPTPPPSMRMRAGSTICVGNRAQIGHAGGLASGARSWSRSSGHRKG